MVPKKEIIVMSYLRQNARMSLTKISRDTGIPVSSIYEIIRTNENRLIKKHTCILDFQAIGFATRVNILMSVGKDEREALREFLLKHRNVNSVLKINNGYNFFVDALFETLKQHEEFAELIETKVPSIKMEHFFIIDEIKREGFMDNPGLLPVVSKTD